MLPLPRTGLASFPASGSSLSNAPRGPGAGIVQHHSLTVDLSVTVGMQQDKIVDSVAPAFSPREYVVSHDVAALSILYSSRMEHETVRRLLDGDVAEGVLRPLLAEGPGDQFL